MRSSLVPSAMTAASRVKMDKIIPGAKNSSVLISPISSTAMTQMAKAYCVSFFSSFSPAENPQSVAAAICIP